MKILTEDKLNTFIPKNTEVKKVILGTMASCCARNINHEEPKNSPAFYYHDGRNYFWKVLKQILEPENTNFFVSNEEKCAFLEKHGIVLENLVQNMLVMPGEENNSSDEVIYRSLRRGDVVFKVASIDLIEILRTKPLYITCLDKRAIKLLEGYRKENNLEVNIFREIKQLHSPTRIGQSALEKRWKQNNFY